MRKLFILFTFLSVSLMGFATQICDVPLGHLNDPEFGDLNGRILFSVEPTGNTNEYKVTIKPNGGSKKLDYLYIELGNGATTSPYPITAGTDDNGDEFDEMTATFTYTGTTGSMGSIQWSHPSWNGRWGCSYADIDFANLQACGETCSDSDNPSVSAVSVGSISYSSAVLTITASDNVGGSGISQYIVKNGDTQIASSASNVITLTGLTPNTTYNNIKVFAKDGCDNLSSAYNVTSFQTENLIYNQFPTGHLSDPNFGDIYGRILLTIKKVDNATIAVKVEPNNNGTKGIKYLNIVVNGVDHIYGNNDGSGDDLTGFFEIGGLASLNFTFKLWFYCNTPNWTTNQFSVTESQLYSEAPSDTEKPSMADASVSVDSKTHNSVVLAISGATDNEAVTKYVVKKHSDNSSVGEYTPAEGKITVSGLTPATAYDWDVYAKDAAGNISDNSAEVSFTTDAHALVPQAAFSPAPSWPAAQVMAIYSPTYSADCGFGEWGSGSAVVDDTYGKKYTVGPNGDQGYFGMVGFDLNCINMEKLHYDIWVADDATIRFVPIWGGAEQGISRSLTGQQWNSIDIDLDDYTNINDWSSVIQVKLDNMSHGLVFWVANAYFYRETELVDTEAPTNVSASASAGFYTVKLTVSAEDNMGAVNFSILDGETEVATGASASGVATTITVINLTPGTAYNFNVVAKDSKPNAAAPVAVSATTLAVPTAAPTPDVTGKVVVPVFSDAIAGGPSINLPWWEQATVAQFYDLTSTDKLFYCRNFNYQGWDGFTIDATDMQYLHVDVFAPAMTSIIGITPISPGHELSTAQALTAGEWTQLDIPLSVYASANIAWDNIFQFKFDQGTGGEFFLDNVYFWAPVPAKEVIRDGLSNGKWGTICPKQTVEEVEGATFYQISYLEEQGGQPYNMVFDEISGTTLTAGQPYFFIATGDEIRGNKTGAELSEAGAGVNGFYGYIGTSPMELPYAVDYNPAGNNTYVIHENSVYRINGATNLRSERCYINISSSEPSRTAKSAAPGRRRITMGVQNTETATGLDELNASETPLKVVVNGQFFILRGEKMYDATGRLVK